ncbi:MAG: hypothetical protein ACOX7Q_08475 [Kiritimatiellia bacterium]
MALASGDAARERDAAAAVSADHEAREADHGLGVLRRPGARRRCGVANVRNALKGQLAANGSCAG